ncbi:dermonecrotic toxin domain-containing protein [Pseudomonas sp. M20]|uniref:dermonecrotic toxin domain-containing protein n=1 Tax=Pseudomonas sp. M20 TaxID=3379129 RepID=UPI00386EEC43
MKINKEAESQSLREVGEALESISQELMRVPSFSVVLQDTLREALWKVSEGVRLSSLFVNVVAGAKPTNKQPVGRLLDVALECLRSGRAPNYDVNDYGVFDHPSFTSREDLLAQVPISAVEKLLADLLKKLAVDYTAAVRQYWENPTVQKAGGAYPQLSRKSALGVLEANLFTRELEALAIQGLLTAQERALVSTTVQPGLTGTGYGVFIEGQNGKYIEQNAMFVLPLKEPVYEQLVPGVQGAVVLYSASRGLEVFSSTSILEQTLLKRLGAPEAQEEFLQALPLSERAGFAYVHAIRFLKVRANLFERFAEKRLQTMYSDVAGYLQTVGMPSTDLDKIVVAVEAAQSLPAIISQAKQRQVQLLKHIERNAWPQWLKSTSEANQEVYVSLQTQLLETEVKHHDVTHGVSSLKDYARLVVEDFISPGKDERIDPDTLFVKVTHTVPLADGKKVELIERKTLTQAFMHGTHDLAGQYQIVPEVPSSLPKLSPSSILRAIQTLNVRVAYTSAQRLLYSTEEFSESLREVFGRRTALSMFSAILQKHVSPAAQDLVTRYNFGDVSIETLGVALKNWFKPFNGLLVYRRKGVAADHSAHVLHMPGSPVGQDWFEFADLKSLQHKLAQWATKPEIWAYMLSQAHASDSAEMQRDYLSKKPFEILNEWWWSKIKLVDLAEKGPLFGAVKNHITWNIDQTEVATPQWYRKANSSDQQLLNRLSHDFKAIHHHSRETLAVEPFKQFASQLVKQELKQYFARTGASVDINPDEVWVNFHADSKISLTDLFIQWHTWRSDVSAFEKFFTWVNPLLAGLGELREQLRKATFWTFTGQRIDQLDAKIINDLIDLRPGEKYLQYLKDKFLNASDIDLKASLYRKTKQNEMLRSALIQKIKGELSVDQYNWLQALINGFDRDLPRQDTVTTASKPGIGVYEFTLRGRALVGAYVFGRRVSGRDEFFVYIPDTPDGKDFFPVQELAGRLKSVTFNKKVLSLARLEHQQEVKNLLDTYWDSIPVATGTPELTNSYPVLAFKQEYLAKIGQLVADVDFQTTSYLEALWKDVRVLAEFALDVASMFIAPLGLALTVLRITESVVLGIVASSQGSDEAANAHFASAWRGAILLYVGKVAAIGAPVNPIALLSSVRDFADVVKGVTGVEVSISYVTAVTAPPAVVNSTTRLLN